MGGIYSGKSLISYNKKIDTSSIINEKDDKKIKFWKGNSLDYKKIKNKEKNIFYLINNPIEECLDISTYDKSRLNEDIYYYIDKLILSFLPNISFRATAIMDETDPRIVTDFTCELLDIISYEECYEKYSNNNTITGAGVIIKPEKTFQTNIESFSYNGNVFTFYFVPVNIYMLFNQMSYDPDEGLEQYVQFFVSINSNNETSINYNVV